MQVRADEIQRLRDLCDRICQDEEKEHLMTSRRDRMATLSAGRVHASRLALYVGWVAELAVYRALSATGWEPRYKRDGDGGIDMTLDTGRPVSVKGSTWGHPRLQIPPRAEQLPPHADWLYVVVGDVPTDTRDAVVYICGCLSGEVALAAWGKLTNHGRQPLPPVPKFQPGSLVLDAVEDVRLYAWLRNEGEER